MRFWIHACTIATLWTCSVFARTERFLPQKQHSFAESGIISSISQDQKTAEIVNKNQASTYTSLRILGVGDSLTVGFPNLGDGAGYRTQLKATLDKKGYDVIFAGTEHLRNTTPENYYAAWSAKTIRFMNDHLDASLAQHPNMILVHAGTNDVNADTRISIDGNSLEGVVQRLSLMLDKMISACPDAVILLAAPLNSCADALQDNLKAYQRLIPEVARRYHDAGAKVLPAHFKDFPADQMLGDCVHPTIEGYNTFGQAWARHILNISKDYITEPIGPAPIRHLELGSSSTENTTASMTTTTNILNTSSATTQMIRRSYMAVILLSVFTIIY